MSTNPAYKPSEGKREEFRKYLEKNGVMDALTKVLVNLYEEVEKPDDALEFIRDKLAIQAGLETQKQMQAKLDETQARITELEQEIEQLRVGVGDRGEVHEVLSDEVEPPRESLSEQAQPTEEPPADVSAEGAPTETAE